MARNRKTSGKGQAEPESMNSGDMGERNRNNPGRSVTELGLDQDEARGQNVLGTAGIRDGAKPGVSDDAATGGGNLAGAGEGVSRRDPPLMEDVAIAEGGIGQSGGAAGGERGHAGTSDRGAGGPLGDMRGGPGQHKSTSRGDLDRGTADADATRPDGG